MNVLSKKADVVLLLVSLVGIVASTTLVFFSGGLLHVMESFLETKVFHREFELSKWRDTINALLAFPLFIVIFVDAVLFLKLSDRTKVILLLVYAVVVLFFIAICSYTRSMEFIDSDMASEILLAEECFREKSFWPRTWNYSTEIRLLNTQLVAAPIFAFTSSWIVVKAVSATLLSLLLPLSLWFLLGQLRIRKLWSKLLWCLLMLCPWSDEMWRIVQFGNYYIPHIAIAFVVVGLFLSLTYRELSAGRLRVFFGIYVFLSFISGLSGIRYILYFLFPLTTTMLGLAVNNLFKNRNHFCFKTFFIEDRGVFYSCLALLLGGVGYIVNNLVLSSLFTFVQFNTTAFTSIGDVTLYDVQNAILGILGYKNNVSVFTPSGIINILVYVGLVFFLLCLVPRLKDRYDRPESVFLLFCVVMFIFNAFIFIKTEYIARYFILPLAFIIPCLAVLAQDERIGLVKRYIAVISFVIIFLAGAFVTYGTVLSLDKNTAKYPVRDFLISRGYDFGYGTFWNANVFTFLTNGKVRLGNIEEYHNDDALVITQEYKWDAFLTPDWYYTEDHNGPVFLLLTQAEYEFAKEHNVVERGIEVYSDDFYRVFEYPSHQAFKESFAGITGE